MFKLKLKFSKWWSVPFSSSNKSSFHIVKFDESYNLKRCFVDCLTRDSVQKWTPSTWSISVPVKFLCATKNSPGRKIWCSLHASAFNRCGWMKLFSGLPTLQRIVDETGKCLCPQCSQKLESRHKCLFSFIPSLIRYFIRLNKTDPSNLSCPNSVITKFSRSHTMLHKQLTSRWK